MHEIYVVQAYRFADTEKHSYVVACCSNITRAKEIADLEEIDRGGKYNCMIHALSIDEYSIDEPWSYKTPGFKENEKTIETRIKEYYDRNDTG
jgi:hypothetical protein